MRPAHLSWVGPGTGRRGGQAEDRAGDFAAARGTVLKKVDLRPHKSRYWLHSDDPDFEAKALDLCRLYLDAPQLYQQGERVVCVDEKTAVQALDRTQPVLPLLPGTPERRSHDYKRHGTIDLYAALNLATGVVTHQLSARHRAIEFQKFLNLIDRTVPADLAVHVVLDNSATHKTPAIGRWLVRHPRFEFHFTPTSSSWMNLVERWFSALTTKKLQRSAHCNVKELAADILAGAANRNENPTTFLWHKTA